MKDGKLSRIIGQYVPKALVIGTYAAIAGIGVDATVRYWNSRNAQPAEERVLPEQEEKLEGLTTYNVRSNVRTCLVSNDGTEPTGMDCLDSPAIVDDGLTLVLTKEHVAQHQDPHIVGTVRDQLGEEQVLKVE